MRKVINCQSLLFCSIITYKAKIIIKMNFDLALFIVVSKLCSKIELKSLILLPRPMFLWLMECLVNTR